MKTLKSSKAKDSSKAKSDRRKQFLFQVMVVQRGQLAEVLTGTKIEIFILTFQDDLSLLLIKIPHGRNSFQIVFLPNLNV